MYRPRGLNIHPWCTPCHPTIPLSRFATAFRFSVCVSGTARLWRWGQYQGCCLKPFTVFELIYKVHFAYDSHKFMVRCLSNCPINKHLSFARNYKRLVNVLLNRVSLGRVHINPTCISLVQFLLYCFLPPFMKGLWLATDASTQNTTENEFFSVVCQSLVLGSIKHLLCDVLVAAEDDNQKHVYVLWLRMS